jgi:hypothetical protein
MALNYAYTMVGTAAICTGMIMDEEVIILYAFILFLGLAFEYGGAVVNDMITTEAKKIGKEFDAFFDVQKKLLKTLIKYHVLQVLVISQVKSLLEFSKGEIGTLIEAKKASLDATIVTQMEQKLSYLASKEQAIVTQVQADATSYVTSKVLNIFTTDHADKKALKEKILAENIAKLEAL